jgi:hypothetical protein
MSCSTPCAKKWCTSSTGRLLLKNDMSNWGVDGVMGG